MILTAKTKTLDYTKDMSDLFCKIDKKLSSYSEKYLNKLRFGTNDKIDKDTFFILKNYRDILELKVGNSPCMRNYSLDDIISVIKQYLSSGKIMKFKPFTDLKSLTETEKSKENTPNMYVINKHFGDNITYYHSSNRYITEVSGDNWEQIDW